MRADAAHHLVVDEQDAVAVADLADARIVAVGRHQRVGRRAADRLHDEGDDAVRPLGEDLLLQHVGISEAALVHRQVVAVAIGGRRRHRRHHPHLVGESVGQHAVAGDGQRAEGAAMIGRHAADHLPALRLAGGDRPLPRQLDAGLHRLRPARHEEDAVEAARHAPGKRARQFLGRLVLEMQPVGEGRLVHLPLHRIEHVAVAVADIDGHRSARPVDVAAAVDVPDVDAFGAVDQRPAQPRQVEQVRRPLFGGRFNC